MSVITSAERALLNTHPQQTKLYLSVFRPSIAMICEVDGVYDAATQSIGYTNVTSGSYTNIIDFNYQVALIGTTEGSEDVGRTWVRSATSSSLRFVESDHINWSAANYITVLKYTEIIPVFPRIIQNPSNEEDVIFYKVWDVAYTNQNSILGTFICMGSHYAGFLDGGSATVYWSSSGTTNLLGDNLTHSWIFEGATITGSNAHTPGNVTYTQPGHYRTIYTATSSSGRVDRSIRYVSIYDRPGVGDNTPVLNWEITELSGNRDGVGYTGRIRIREDISSTDIIDGALVVIFKEDWYGSTKQSISKNAKGRETIQFVGYINGGTIQYDYQQGFVEFEVLSPTNLMEITECFSVSVESKPVPTVWYELNDMDVRRAIYHYLAWHSSVLLCCDFEARNLNDHNIQYFDADRTSLYDAVNSILQGALRARLISDSLGKLWAERDVSVIDSAESVLPRTLTITKQDWIEQPNITERPTPDVSFIELGGIAYNPVSGQSTALLASAPGTAPGYRGKVERSQGFALEDQTELNALVGNMYAYMNSRYPSVDLRMRGNFSNFDIAPQEMVRLTVAQEDTPRGLAFNGKAFAVRGVSWSYFSKDQILLTAIQLAEITQGFDGASIVIPIEPPDGDDGGSVDQPPITVPPIPTPVPPTVGAGQVDVYENGEFKITTSKLNFIGSIVRVYANTTEERADIYFDACGCSGAFPGGGQVGCEYTATTAIFTTNLSGVGDTTIWGKGTADPSYTGTSNDPCVMLARVDGNHSFRAPFTGMYSLAFGGIAFTPSINLGDAGDIDFTITLRYSENEVFTHTGNITKIAGQPTPSFAEYFPVGTEFGGIYLQQDEFLDVSCEWSVTDNLGTYNGTVNISMVGQGINPALGFFEDN